MVIHSTQHIVDERWWSCMMMMTTKKETKNHRVYKKFRYFRIGKYIFWISVVRRWSYTIDRIDKPIFRIEEVYRIRPVPWKMERNWREKLRKKNSIKSRSDGANDTRRDQSIKRVAIDGELNEVHIELIRIGRRMSHAFNEIERSSRCTVINEAKD